MVEVALHAFSKKVTVKVLGKNGLSYGWRLKEILEQRANDPAADAAADYVAYAAQFEKAEVPTGECRVRGVRAPPTAFNARLVEWDKHSRHRLHLNFGVQLLRGDEGDAVEVPRGTVACFASKDCLSGVIETPSGKVFLGHFGRDAILPGDLIRANNMEEARSRLSVIDVIMRAIPKEERFETRYGLFCGIAAKHFHHPTTHEAADRHRLTLDDALIESNGRMVRYLLERYNKSVLVGDLEEGNISLEQVVHHQFQKYGVTTCSLHDGVDTYSNKHLYSNREKDRGNNLVLVGNDLPEH